MSAGELEPTKCACPPWDYLEVLGLRRMPIRPPTRLSATPAARRPSGHQRILAFLHHVQPPPPGPHCTHIHTTLAVA